MLVTDMQYIEIPEFPTLRGGEAKRALYEYIRELKEQKSKELTKKQTKALIKLAQGLISAIEAESCSAAAEKKIESPRLVTQLKKTILRCIPESRRVNTKAFF